MSANGGKIFVGVDGGGLFMTTDLLPVELTEINVKAYNDKVQLNWKTATEVNNYGFEIERKAETINEKGQDKWAKIGFVKGNGNSNSPSQYSYTDNKPPAEKLYYRLKQIDNDGKYKYYNAVEVVMELPKEFALMQNMPNPFNPTTAIKFQLPVNTRVTIKVYDLQGREVITLLNDEKTSGTYTVYWNGRNSSGQMVSSGVYLYKLSAGSYTKMCKMNLMK
jgi:hypothetical protein